LRSEKAVGVCRKLHSEELHNLYSSVRYYCDQIKENDVGRAYSMHGEMRNAYEVLLGKPEGKRPHGRPRHRWEDNIKMDFREIVFEGIGWMHLAQDRDQMWALVNTVMNLWITKQVWNFLTS
jgi:hypothetical protein